jgi:hypothetical protein
MLLLLLLLLLQSMLRSSTLKSTAIAAAQVGSNIPREACMFASIAPDGKVRLASHLSLLHASLECA